MTEVLRTIWKEDDGQDLIEYGLLLAVITIAAIAAITGIGTKVGAYFTSANSNLPAAPK